MKLKINIFQAISILLAIGLVASIKFRPIGCFVAGDPNLVGQNTVNFINENLLPDGIRARLKEATIENKMYKLVIEVQGRSSDVYVSGDGKLLFPAAIDMTEEIPKQEIKTAKFDAPDSETPEVMLFVMSFCPFGQQAENAMIPVVELLGDKVTIEPHFIVSVSGEDVNSLHGEFEAKEDMRQACIWKEYGQKVFWSYIKEFNGICNRENIDTCWKEKAEAVGIDVSKIEECVNKEGIELMKADEELTNQYGVRGSPTLIINGEEYYGPRTPDAFKDAICSGFIDPPSECEQNLTTTTEAGSGTC